MIRRAFTMRLKPGALAEYKHHHDHIWPELVDEIERAGIASITTFQRDLDLFLVSEIADEDAWNKLWNSEVHKRWAAIMDPLMHLRDDGIVEAGWLVEVFHLATNGRSGTSAIADSPPDILAEMLAAAGSSSDEPPQSVPAESEAPPPPPAKPHRKVASRRPKPASGKMSPHKKKAAHKKAKRAAKRPKAAAASKPAQRKGKKAAKKSAKKKSATKKAKKAVGKKKARKKRR